MMNVTLVILLIVLAGLIGMAVWLVMLSQQLQSRLRALQQAYPQVDAELRRRHDLVPNLVEAVRAFMPDEEELLRSASTAHLKAVSSAAGAAREPAEARSIQNVAASEELLRHVLTRLLGAAHACAPLRADPTMRRLSEEIGATEGHVTMSAYEFNEQVRLYNAQLESFPTILLADLLGLRAVEPLNLRASASAN